MTTPPRVLVVEDDPSVLRLMRGYLTDLGCEPVEARSGEAALALLQGPAPSLLCLDLTLPRASGLAVCAYARAAPALARVPILVVSARDLPLDRAQAEEAGADAFLAKPFRREEFARFVQGLLNSLPGLLPGLARKVR